MIVITKIEYTETPNNPARICKQQPLLSDNHPKVNYEYVYGESFIDAVGNRVTIGMIEEVSEILKMPFIIIRRQQELMTGEKIDIRLYHSTLNKVDESEAMEL